ncbi:hypothetical protein DPMN_080751 [Dreissena polymorpha]|uniref:EGF-like domain-containing protein n=1 Tax=Dreissena polymorpha TaxID=45954 RepID=A0A9D3YRG4_DREPO|nr:hypothetical protein DPMN_080751 [Dreissena polymorpha]
MAINLFVDVLIVSLERIILFKGCVCDSGWSGVSCDVDIDECKDYQMTCNEPNTRCLNTPGNATCACNVGYRRNSTSGLCEGMRVL